MIGYKLYCYSKHHNKLIMNIHIKDSTLHRVKAIARAIVKTNVCQYIDIYGYTKQDGCFQMIVSLPECTCDSCK